MANTIPTALLPLLFSAARIVPRELTGFVGAVTRDFSDQGVSQGSTVTVPVVPSLTVGNATPSQTFSAGADRVLGSRTLTLNQFKEVTWNLTAEEDRTLLNGAGNAQNVFKQTVEQAIRSIVNGAETYLGGIVKNAASRALGTAGTTPFASDLTTLTGSRKILNDNGVPMGDRSVVIDTSAELNLMNLTQLQKFNESGGPDQLRAGVIGSLFGFDVRPSAGVASHTKGTGTGYTTSAAGFAVGATSIPIITGTGTVLAGDVIAIAGDTNKYVAATGVAAPGTIVLAEPGLRVAIAASATAITIENGYVGNVAMHRAAVQLVLRPGLQPDTPDVQQETILDPQTGLSFLFMRNVGKNMTSYYMQVVYDAFSANPFAIATLRG